MTIPEDGQGSGRRHWLVALAILVVIMVIVPVVARFY